MRLVYSLLALALINMASAQTPIREGIPPEEMEFLMDLYATTDPQ